MQPIDALNSMNTHQKHAYNKKQCSHIIIKENNIGFLQENSYISVHITHLASGFSNKNTLQYRISSINMHQKHQTQHCMHQMRTQMCTHNTQTCWTIHLCTHMCTN